MSLASRESCLFVSVLIGLCTQEMCRNALLIGLSGFVGAVLVVGYSIGLVMPQVTVVAVTIYLSNIVLVNLSERGTS